MKGGFTNYYDKVPSNCRLQLAHVPRIRCARVPRLPRVAVPISACAVLMPSYVNIGAYVDSGTMVDTWATVGSCAQIGRTCICQVRRIVACWSQCRPRRHHRRQLFHRCALGSGRRRDRRSRLGDFHGRCTSPEHQDLRSETGEVTYGRIPAGSVVVSATCIQGRHLQPVLRGDREESRREDPWQGRHQRIAARHLILYWTM